MTVGERIRNRRIELNMSQDELAARAGYCAKPAISRIEHSGNEVSMKQIKRLSEALDCSMAYLMGWETEADKVPKSEEAVEENTVNETPKGSYIMTDDLPKAVELFEKYQNAPQYIQEAIENLLKSSQSDKQ